MRCDKMTDSWMWRVFWMLAGFAIVWGGLTHSGPEQTVFAWELDKPIVTYFGQTTWWPGATFEQIVDYSADGNFNLVWGSHTETFVRAEQRNLGVLAVDPTWWQYELGDLANPATKAIIDGKIATLNTLPAFYGYYLKDEPAAADFPAIAEIASYLRVADPNHLGYVNLSGIWHVTSQQQVTDYRTYVNDYINTVQPELLSYDSYQMMNHFDGTTYVGKSDWNGYLLNLGIIADAAKGADIPFMNIVQGCRWNAGWRTPDSNELRYLTYSTLAYGAQAISYFNWYSNYTAPLPGEPYYNGSTSVGALVPESWDPLVPTDVYTAVTPLNAEFVEVAEELQGVEHIETYLKGYAAGSGPPGPTLPPVDAPFTVSGISDSMVYADYDPLKGVLLGLFGSEGATSAGANTALVQNIDYTNSRSFTLNGPRNFEIFDATTGVWTPTGQNSAALNLAPGDGVLVRMLPNMGDVNNDGWVNGADTAILAGNWQKQSGATWAQGDLNADGKVNDVDATLLAANWDGSGPLPPTPELLLSVDVWGEWNTSQPGFTDTIYCDFNGTMDPSVTTAAGITVTLDGLWGGRNRGETATPDVPPDFTEHGLLVDWGGNWSANTAESGNTRTVTISGLEADKTYNMSLWGHEWNNPQGWDVSANGILVVDNFRWTPVPYSNDQNRVNFEATADGDGVVVLEYSDPTNGAGIGEYPTYMINAIQIYDPNPVAAVPEPSTICLILIALGMFLGAKFFRRD